MNRSKVMRILPWIVTPALVVVIVVVWHLIVTIGKVNPFLFPPPTEVGAKFVGLFTSEPAATAAVHEHRREVNQMPESDLTETKPRHWECGSTYYDVDSHVLK